MLYIDYQVFELFPANERAELMLYKRHFLNTTASGSLKISFLEMSLFYFELMGDVYSEMQTGTACQH